MEFDNYTIEKSKEYREERFREVEEWRGKKHD